MGVGIKPGGGLMLNLRGGGRCECIVRGGVQIKRAGEHGRV